MSYSGFGSKKQWSLAEHAPIVPTYSTLLHFINWFWSAWTWPCQRKKSSSCAQDVHQVKADSYRHIRVKINIWSFRSHRVEAFSPRNKISPSENLKFGCRFKGLSTNSNSINPLILFCCTSLLHEQGHLLDHQWHRQESKTNYLILASQTGDHAFKNLLSKTLIRLIFYNIKFITK